MKKKFLDFNREKNEINHDLNFDESKATNESIENKRKEIIQKIKNVKLLDFKKDQGDNSWANGLTSSTPISVPFHICFKMIKFPKGGNEWGALIGISSKKTNYENLNQLFYNTNFMWLMNVLQGKKIHISGSGENCLNLNESYTEMEMKMKLDGMILVKTNLMKEFVMLYQNMDVKIPYYPCISFANYGHIEVWMN